MSVKNLVKYWNNDKDTTTSTSFDKVRDYWKNKSGEKSKPKSKGKGKGKGEGKSKTKVDEPTVTDVTDATETDDEIQDSDPLIDFLNSMEPKTTKEFKSDKKIAKKVQKLVECIEKLDLINESRLDAVNKACKKIKKSSKKLKKSLKREKKAKKKEKYTSDNSSE